MKKILLTAFLLSFMFNYGQKNQFLSNNGFFGSFEMIGNELKPNSIIIEKFKTSVGEFARNDLKNEGIIFPYACPDCSFTIEKIGTPIKVKDTRGRGFSKIVSAVKNQVQNKQEALQIREMISSIATKSTLEEQRRIVYMAYPHFSNKVKIDQLAKRVEIGEFLPDFVDSPAHIEETETSQNLKLPEETASAEKETIDPAQVPKPAEIQINRAPSKKIKTSKCQKNIEKLEIKLGKAKKVKDNVIINELETALKKLLKKCT